MRNSSLLQIPLLVVLMGLAAAGEVAAQIDTALGVRSLPLEQALEGRAVKLQGTVILSEKVGTVFIQDATAGTFFRAVKPITDIKEGDLVEVEGITAKGLYLTGIEKASFKILAHDQPITARPVNYDDLASGRFHYQCVQVEGIVRSVVEQDETRAVVRLAMGSRVLEVRVDVPAAGYENLVDSLVRVQGLAAGTINDMRQLVQPYVRISGWQALSVIQPAPAVDDLPLLPAANLLRFNPGGASGHRVRVGGTVTAVFDEGLAFIRDEDASVALSFSGAAPPKVGDTVTAYGFPVMAQYTPTLEDAALLAHVPGARPDATAVPLDELFKKGHEGDLVTVKGTVTGLNRGDGTRNTLADGKHTLEIRLMNGGAKLEAAPGAVVEATGICRIEAASGKGFNSRPTALSLWLRSLDDVRVLQSPPWWTVERLLSALGLLASAVLAAAVWIVMLRRQVRRQTNALSDRIKHEAALEERQRIAREFHDTLEQELAGLSIRMDAAASRPLDDKARGLLEASRSLVGRIQAEARNLVADLRDDASHVQDLKAALEDLAQRHPGPVPSVVLEAESPAPELPPHVVHHLRMIAQEAVTNALKHAGASRITLRLSATDTCLHLAVSDDGRGFDAAAETKGRPGHFGCMGIRERCQRIGATVRWTSQPGQGTTLEIDRPLLTLPQPDE